MATKSEFLDQMKAYPDTMKVNFEGKVSTLGELRKGSSWPAPFGGHATTEQSFPAPAAPTVGPCPKCKSNSTVQVKNGSACNACGHLWGGAQ